MLAHSYFFPRPEALIGGRKNKRFDNLFQFKIIGIESEEGDNKPGETVVVEFMRGRREMQTDIVLSVRPERFEWD